MVVEALALCVCGGEGGCFLVMLVTVKVVMSVVGLLVDRLVE